MTPLTNFEFATAGRIIFGPGRRSELFAALEPIGARGLLVTGREPGRAGWILEGLDAEIFAIPSEPTVDQASQGAELARKAGVQFVIGVGGGSAIDAAKAIAALTTNPGNPLEYLEVIGKAIPLQRAPLPFIAIPTTAGTGAEVTRNAVLSAPEHKVKVSLRSPRMLSALAIVDPELSYDLPPGLTASTGLDALTQLIEPFVSARANPITDALCREGIPRAARALPVAFRNGKDLKARSEMALASLFGGLALANAGLGAVHGLAAPIGGMFPAPHGAVCAALLPHVVEVNHRALQERSPDSLVLRRFDELGRRLTGEPSAGAREAVLWLHAVVAELRIPPLRSYGLDRGQFAELVSRACEASSMKANPITLTREELHELLDRAY